MKEVEEEEEEEEEKEDWLDRRLRAVRREIWLDWEARRRIFFFSSFTSSELTSWIVSVMGEEALVEGYFDKFVKELVRETGIRYSRKSLYRYYLRAMDRFFYLIKSTGGRSVECIKEFSLDDIDTLVGKELKQITYLRELREEVEDSIIDYFGWSLVRIALILLRRRDFL